MTIVLILCYTFPLILEKDKTSANYHHDLISNVKEPLGLHWTDLGRRKSENRDSTEEKTVVAVRNRLSCIRKRRLG
ncbi:hypothetical protein C8J55DRAFT_514941 [Lentinula edodes]|uniref:Uncharacterized protein n=1 Tax=Lentinula lateritia TaxID=40482 RepID=A0A9W9AE02_9AGAR|nr:hypothetical protein C8J55DRAFT_514941 [Lentinula edodes]